MNAALFEARCVALGATTTEEKAKLCGTDWTTLWRLLGGRNSPRLDTARQIAAALGVTVDDLWPARRAA